MTVCDGLPVHDQHAGEIELAVAEDGAGGGGLAAHDDARAIPADFENLTGGEIVAELERAEALAADVDGDDVAAGGIGGSERGSGRRDDELSASLDVIANRTRLGGDLN